MWNPFSISKIVTGVAGGANALVKTFKGSKQERDQQSHDQFTSVQKAFGAEFNTRPNRTWWDSLWDGFNRVPRPAFVVLTIGYFVLAYVNPIEFQVLNVSLGTIPDTMWMILAGILGFYFSSRHFQKLHEGKSNLALTKHQFTETQKRITELRAEPPILPAAYQVARSEMETGVKEIVGAKNNPQIVEYHKATDLTASDDETAWCSSFVNWCMLTVGAARTNKANARSWLSWGKELKEPHEGCVVVFKRGSKSWQGHVGFFVRIEGEQVLCLGGNQGNEINISGYPKSKVLGFRGSV